jgi:site-specific DNA-adenine methylase
MVLLNKFLLNYDGNKFLESKKYLTEEIIKHKNINYVVEPFGGIFGFSRAFKSINENFKGKFLINDINAELIELLKEIKKDPKQVIIKLEEELLIYKDDIELTRSEKISNALKIICRSFQAHFLNIQKGKTKIKNFKLMINDYVDFFKQVEFFNMEATEFLKMVDTKYKKSKLIYFDPPYFNSHNKCYNDNFKNKNDYHDGTTIYLKIKEYYEKSNNVLIFVMNKIDIINYIYKDFFYKQYEGRYQNMSGGKKSKKIHNIYVKNM